MPNRLSRGDNGETRLNRCVREAMHRRPETLPLYRRPTARLCILSCRTSRGWRGDRRPLEHAMPRSIAETEARST
jgi:hypothetical protein